MSHLFVLYYSAPRYRMAMPSTGTLCVKYRYSKGGSSKMWAGTAGPNMGPHFIVKSINYWSRIKSGLRNRIRFCGSASARKFGSTTLDKILANAGFQTKKCKPALVLKEAGTVKVLIKQIKQFCNHHFGVYEVNRRLLRDRMRVMCLLKTFDIMVLWSDTDISGRFEEPRVFG